MQHRPSTRTNHSGADVVLLLPLSQCRSLVFCLRFYVPVTEHHGTKNFKYIGQFEEEPSERMEHKTQVDSK